MQGHLERMRRQGTHNRWLLRPSTATFQVLPFRHLPALHGKRDGISRMRQAPQSLWPLPYPARLPPEGALQRQPGAAPDRASQASRRSQVGTPPSLRGAALPAPAAPRACHHKEARLTRPAGLTKYQFLLMRMTLSQRIPRYILPQTPWRPTKPPPWQRRSGRTRPRMRTTPAPRQPCRVQFFTWLRQALPPHKHWRPSRP